MIHLHRHSEFSLLDGVGTAEQYAQKAAELGQSALALTDHGTLSGALHHIKACNDAGIMPIVGVEAYFKPNRHIKDADHKQAYHMTILAKDMQGWKNLIYLTSEAYATGFYYKPCIDWEVLSKYKDGLVVTSACIASYFNQHLLREDFDECKRFLQQILSLFPDSFYFELMPHDFGDQRVLNIELINWANEYGIPLLATGDVHYPYADWSDTQDVALMIGTGQSLEKRETKKLQGDEVYAIGVNTLYLMSEQEIRAEFSVNHPDIPADIVDTCIANTDRIVDRMDFFAVDTSPKLPRIEQDAGHIVDQWCLEGLERIGKTKDTEYTSRLERELGILRSKGVVDYFYIIGDLVRWAKEQGIYVGAGRGSAAGCLVSYLIRITSIDPIAHELLFERFLNPERKGLPDIDIDIQHDRRDEVKQYLADKWGQDKVADVITHQTFKPRSSIQNVARVLNIDYDYTMSVTNTIDKGDTDPLESIARGNNAVKRFADAYPEAWKHATRLQGQIKAISKHASAVVVTDKSVDSYMPIMRAKDQSICTAWSDRAEYPIISDFGFLKIDLLGQEGISKQHHAMRLAGVSIALDDLDICRDPNAYDDKVLEGFRKGLTLGVFQFNKRGITNLLRRISPTTFADLAAANALYRPGPLEGGIANDYGLIKRGDIAPIEWPAEVGSIMDETYGLMIYQEQIMKIVQALGGFSQGEADDFRKAIGKLYRLSGGEARKFMNQYKDRFFVQASDRGVDRPAAEDIWNKILAFGGYGFNKSHSVSYAVQSYFDMWIKINYPLAYYAALLSNEPDKAPEAMRESQLLDIQFLPPDINNSDRLFNVSNNGIRFGLSGIKHVGDVALDEIMTNRPYTSYEDFASKVVAKRCNKTVKASLVDAGAFDSMGERNALTDAQRGYQEKEVLGVALSSRGLDKALMGLVEERIWTEDEFEQASDGVTVTVGGEIINSRVIRTRKGDPMAFVDVAFGPNQYSCTMFPKIFEKYSDIIVNDELVLIKGQKDDRGAVIVNVACRASELQEAIADR